MVVSSSLTIIDHWHVRSAPSPDRLAVANWYGNMDVWMSMQAEIARDGGWKPLQNEVGMRSGYLAMLVGSTHLILVLGTRRKRWCSRGQSFPSGDISTHNAFFV